MNISTREKRIRKELADRGFFVQRCGNVAKKVEAGNYIIIDARKDEPMIAANHLTLDEVEAFLNELIDFSYNRDDKFRQRIMGIETNYDTEVVQFRGMNLEKLNELVENGFIDLNERQNEAPAIREFREFLMQHSDEEISLHGYFVSPDRADYRITVEGIEACFDRMTDFADALNATFGNADVVKICGNHFYCWYD